MLWQCHSIACLNGRHKVYLPKCRRFTDILVYVFMRGVVVVRYSKTGSTVEDGMTPVINLAMVVCGRVGGVVLDLMVVACVLKRTNDSTRRWTSSVRHTWSLGGGVVLEGSPNEV